MAGCEEKGKNGKGSPDRYCRTGNRLILISFSVTEEPPSKVTDLDQAEINFNGPNEFNAIIDNSAKYEPANDSISNNNQ
jgi:hypothetical protein